jgi:hypothetical protein
MNELLVKEKSGVSRRFFCACSALKPHMHVIAQVIALSFTI